MSQTLHLNFSQWFNGLESKLNHIFSERLSSTLTTQTILTTSDRPGPPELTTRTTWNAYTTWSTRITLTTLTNLTTLTTWMTLPTWTTLTTCLEQLVAKKVYLNSDLHNIDLEH